MNDRPSSLNQMGDERRSSSPKRKKIRQKYAPKACVSCRRSKLKCTGANPCQRCIDNGKRCFFSEDETAAQVLQTLSRPTPAPHQVASLTNGNGTSRRNILPRHGSIERRASDASVLGMSMETRMARIETMMEALLHERGMTMTPMGSIEREENGSDGYRSENAFALPLLDPINPALAHLGQSAAPQDPIDWRHPTFPHEPRITGNDTSSMISLDGRTLLFPSLVEYRKYMISFFGDIHLRHPCIEEDEFRMRGERMITVGTVQTNEVLFLALNYTIFACCDVLTNTSPPDDRPPGWHWFLISNDLVDKKALLNGLDYLTRLQLLLFDALYLTFADMPGLAYTTIGLASRIVLQYGLHQQASISHLDADQIYIHACVFWNVFVTDRYISLSCGRPYSIRDEEIDLELPMNVFNKLPYHRSAGSNLKQYINLHMIYVTLLARRATYIWGGVVDTDTRFDRLDRMSLASIESEIDNFLRNDLPTMLTIQIQGLHLNNYDKTGMMLSDNNATLLLRRRIMSNLQYDSVNGYEFGARALDTIERNRKLFSTDALITPRYPTYRHYMISSVACALRVFCALLVRDLSSPSLNLQHNHDTYIKGFQDALAMFITLKDQLGYAKRVFEDFTPLLSVVNPVVQKWLSSTPDQRAQQGFDLVKYLIPHNITELFPYCEMTPNLQGDPRMVATRLSPGPNSNEWSAVEQNNAGKGTVLWLF